MSVFTTQSDELLLTNAQAFIDDVEDWMDRLSRACIAAAIPFDDERELETAFGFAYEGEA